MRLDLGNKVKILEDRIYPVDLMAFKMVVQGARGSVVCILFIYTWSTCLLGA